MYHHLWYLKDFMSAFRILLVSAFFRLEADTCNIA